MKNLENIPKKEVFSVPEGYFDTLPGKIQARISAEKPDRQPAFVFRYKLQYVLPVIALLAIGLYWFAPADRADAESIIASVQTEELVAYLNDSELSTEDLLETLDFNEQDVQDIETEVYELNLDNENLDELLEDLENI
jgi:hypothetical protein